MWRIHFKIYKVYITIYLTNDERELKFVKYRNITLIATYLYLYKYKIWFKERHE